MRGLRYETITRLEFGRSVEYSKYNNGRRVEAARTPVPYSEDDDPRKSGFINGVLRKLKERSAQV